MSDEQLVKLVERLRHVTAPKQGDDAKAANAIERLESELAREEEESEHYVCLAFVDPGANPPVAWKDRAENAERELDEARAEIEMIRQSEQAGEQLHKQWHDRALKAEKEKEWLKQALEDYGRHLTGCAMLAEDEIPIPKACDCGLLQSIESPAPRRAELPIEMEPHRFMPDFKQTGDCSICGNTENSPLHVWSTTEREAARKNGLTRAGKAAVESGDAE